MDRTALLTHEHLSSISYTYRLLAAWRDKPLWSETELRDKFHGDKDRASRYLMSVHKVMPIVWIRVPKDQTYYMYTEYLTKVQAAELIASIL